MTEVRLNNITYLVGIEGDINSIDLNTGTSLTTRINVFVQREDHSRAKNNNIFLSFFLSLGVLLLEQTWREWQLQALML